MISDSITFVIKAKFPFMVYFRDDSNTKVFPQSSSMNSITHNQKREKILKNAERS
jgi:hypothetical protein